MRRLKGWPGCGAAGQHMAFTLATPEEAAAPVEFILPKLPAVQLPNTKYADKSLPHYSRKKDGPLVIHVPTWTAYYRTQSTTQSAMWSPQTPTQRLKAALDTAMRAALPAQDQLPAAVPTVLYAFPSSHAVLQLHGSYLAMCLP